MKKKIIIKSIDETWSSDLFDMDDYGPKNNRGYSYILVVIDKLSKGGWTIFLKNRILICGLLMRYILSTSPSVGKAGVNHTESTCKR